jgi:ArsR family transcriptional regulator
MSKKQLPILRPPDAGAACCTPLAREPLAAADATALAAGFKALSDPVRLRLLSLIASHEGGEACVCDLTGAFDVTGPTISHHLKVLREAGLIDCERRGTWVYYWILPAALDRLGAVLAVDALAAATAGAS